MAAIGGIGRTVASVVVSARRRSSDQAAAIEPSRALTVVQPPPVISKPRTGSNRAAASFLAQLIAADQQAPQTRLRRRAEPAQATVVYRAVAALPAHPEEPQLSRLC